MVEKITPLKAAPLRDLMQEEYIPKVSTVEPVSSVERSKQVARPPLFISKPQLEAPRSVIWRTLDNLNRTELVGEALLDLNQHQLDVHFNRIKELDHEQMLKMQEHLECETDTNFWGFLKELGQLLLSALSAVLGFSLLASGGSVILGGALITSGILAVVNFAFKEMGVWDWIAEKIAGENEDLKKKIATLLPTSIGLITSVVGLVGSVGALWFHQLDIAQKIVMVGQTALNISNGIVEIGKGSADMRMQLTTADLHLLSSKSLMEKMHIEDVMGQWQEIAEQQNQVSEEAGRLIQVTRRSLQITQQII